MARSWCPCGAGCYGVVDGQCYPTREAFRSREAAIGREIHAHLVRYLAELSDDRMRARFLEGMRSLGKDEAFVRRLRRAVHDAREAAVDRHQPALL